MSGNSNKPKGYYQAKRKDAQRAAEAVKVVKVVFDKPRDSAQAVSDNLEFHGYNPVRKHLNTRGHSLTIGMVSGIIRGRKIRTFTYR
jgi:hypothetical protein